MKKSFIMKNSKRGISIAEVMVALAVITIVTAATVTLMITSANAENKAADAVHIVNTAENVVACFRFAENDEEFFEAVKLLDPNFKNARKNEYILEKSCYTVTLNVDYSTGMLNFLATDENGNSVYSFFYGGGINP